MRTSHHKNEAVVRRDLAIACRLFAYFGWTDLGAAHLSAQFDGREPGFFINPRGGWLGETKAKSLFRCSQYQSQSSVQENGVGVDIHRAIYSAREDVHCVLHTHTTASIAVSMQEGGLQQLSQHAAMFFERLAYHETSVVDESNAIVRDLAAYNAMILRHHGLLVCGNSVPEAFVRMHLLQRACEEQLAGQMTGAVLVPMTNEICQAISDQADMLIGSHANAAWPALSRLVAGGTK